MKLWPARRAEASTWRLSGSCSAKRRRLRSTFRRIQIRTANGMQSPTSSARISEWMITESSQTVRNVPMKVKRTIRSGGVEMSASVRSATKRPHQPVRSNIFSVPPSILSARAPLGLSFSGTGIDTNSAIRFRSVPRFKPLVNETTASAISAAARIETKSVISGDVKSLCRKDSWYGLAFAVRLRWSFGVV